MDTQQMKALARRFYDEVINQKKLEVVDELCSPNYKDHDPTNPSGDREGLKQSFQEFFRAFPDIRATVDDVTAEGDKVVVRSTIRGTHRGEFGGIPPTSRQIEIAGIDIVHLTNGRADEHWGLIDQLGMLQQLGVMQTPGQTSERAA